jgi:hypothetical protein
LPTGTILNDLFNEITPPMARKYFENAGFEKREKKAKENNVLSLHCFPLLSFPFSQFSL